MHQEVQMNFSSDHPMEQAMTTTAYLSVHNVNRVRVKNYHPKNSHAIELWIMQDDGNQLEMNIFGLPEDRAIEMVKALGDAKTTVYASGDYQNLIDYLTTKGVFDAIEGK
jgi:hypothetical protein